MTTSEMVARLHELAADARSAVHSLFAAGAPIHVARAPGRLDVMGGIADYSGSLVLEMPIAEAAFVAMQASPGELNVTVISLPQEQNEPPRRVSLPADEWAALRSGDYDVARQRLRENPAEAWAAYVVGPVLVMLRETRAELARGLRILVDSRVPEGKGVSSSAAVEVAAMRAAATLADRKLSGEALAKLCQMAENRVVGAPCGIMDQMTSALGRQDQLLALLCQPATVEGYVPVPQGISLWGVDSGIRHAVSGSDYTSVRTGAFMGYRIIADAAGIAAQPAGDAACGPVAVKDPRWHGYLANVSPAEFDEKFARVLPREMTGCEFLARFRGTTDGVTRVDPDRTYAVREPTFHPIGENARVHRFRELLLGPITHEALSEMGELMFAAHASYSACGLGSDGTDLLVKLVRDRGTENGLYGAKITGGGSGGTVCILGRTEANPLIEEIAAEYTRLCNRNTYTFRGSSPGACAEEVVRTMI
jgi:galactokinase